MGCEYRMSFFENCLFLNLKICFSDLHTLLEYQEPHYIHRQPFILIFLFFPIFGATVTIWRPVYVALWVCYAQYLMSNL